MSKETTVFQKHIVDKLRELPQGFEDNIVEKCTIRKILSNNRLPRKHHKQFLEELVDLGYIKIINRIKIEIIINK